MSKPFYDSDLTEEEWQQVEPLLPPTKPVGEHREVSLSLFCYFEVRKAKLANQALVC
jgi:transposase